MLQGIPSLMVARRRTEEVITLRTNLVSYWTLDEGAGSTKIDSHGSNDLSDPTSCVSFASIINNGVYINNNANYLPVASNATLQVTSDFTFSIWVRQDDLSSTRYIISKYDGSTSDYSLSHDATNGFQFAAGGGTNVVVGSPAGQFSWYHIVAWFDSADNKVRMRINDATTYTAGGTATLAQNNGAFILGALTSTPTFTHVGLLDECAFWKRVLTPQEITNLYNGGAGLAYSSF